VPTNLWAFSFKRLGRFLLSNLPNRRRQRIHLEVAIALSGP
jgi:hypothetical protein